MSRDGGILSRGLVAWGQTVGNVARHAGRMTYLFLGIVTAFARGRVPMRAVVDQIWWMGVQSIPIVIVTAMLGGIVTSQQGGYQFTGAIPLYILGSVVASSVVLELGPVMTAIVMVGRVGARITAEFGTMKVSEQIDALHSLGRDPVVVLAAPRVAAGLLVVPVLVAIANVVGVFTGMVAANLTIGLGSGSFFYGAQLYWHKWDLVYSLTKALAFGFWIPFIAVHMGFETKGGAEGVGKATTSAVVFMTLAVLILDASMPPIFLN
ncbi:MAG TPA: ABC transporter permease [Longimicrobiales bacterium]|nr:ABC transporter permease [Longimicrobiales bacterium]